MLDSLLRIAVGLRIAIPTAIRCLIPNRFGCLLMSSEYESANGWVPNQTHLSDSLTESLSDSLADSTRDRIGC